MDAVTLGFSPYQDNVMTLQFGQDNQRFGEAREFETGNQKPGKAQEVRHWKLGIEYQVCWSGIS